MPSVPSGPSWALHHHPHIVPRHAENLADVGNCAHLIQVVQLRLLHGNELFQNYAELSPKLAPDLMVHVLASQDPGHIADYIAQNIPMRNSDKQSVLEELRPARRLEKLYRLEALPGRALVLSAPVPAA